MVKLIISRYQYVYRSHGMGYVHIDGLTFEQLSKLAPIVRHRVVVENIGDERRHQLVFDTEEQAALFKLEHL